jgi:hypothetical protein
MTVLDSVLQEEYDRLIRMKVVMEKELAELPKGYISKKIINNKPYYYLQKRDGLKISGTYIAEDELPNVIKQVDKRKQLQKSLREISVNIKKIKRVVK